MVMCKYSSRLAPTVRPFVEELFTSGLFSQHDLDLITPLSGLALHKIDGDEGVCDRFKLILPFAGYSVVWEVIFDGTCPDVPPDFIFDDESFLCECELDCIPSLTEWNANNKKSFVHVITDLLKLYSRHQLQGVERSVSPSIRRWLDPENIEEHGFKVEILNGSQKSSPYSTLSRQANTSLQYGTTSVLVEVPIMSELLDSHNLQFSVHYIFKSHTQMFEEKINFSPELKGWLQPYLDNFRKQNKWIIDSTALSAAIQVHIREIMELLRKSVQEFKQRQELLLSLYHHIMSKNELNPCMLEFDFNEFQFSSYLLQDKRLFAVDFARNHPRGRLLGISADCSTKPLGEINRDNLTDPSFDIVDFLSRYDS